MTASDLMQMQQEAHLSSKEVAANWGVSAATIIRIFRDKPGVLRFGSRRHCVLRIPVSVVQRVREEMAGR